MNALVYHGPGQRAWEAVPDPVLFDPTDAIVRIDTATICGTDLHILKGDVPAVTPGRILGHEGVGTITEVGSSVTTLAVGETEELSETFANLHRMLQDFLARLGETRLYFEGTVDQKET